MKCFFHKADFDGECSASIVKHKYKNCELIPIDYGDQYNLDVIDNENVFIVDFSFPIKDMLVLAKRLYENGKYLIWIDHHISSIGEFNKLLDNEKKYFKGCLDDKHSACKLTWVYLNRDVEAPEAIELLSLYDSFTFTKDNEDNVLHFQYGMRATKNTSPLTNMNLWNKVISSDKEFIDNTINIGINILNYTDVLTKEMCQKTNIIHVLKFKDKKYNVLCVNGTIKGKRSFDSIYDKEKHDILLLYYFSKDKKTVISIYSNKEDIDVSKIAEYFEGGGHKGAAGFILNSNLWDIFE